ncbi:MAG: septal ring lytic transglycosylase RlpA family protein [Thermodesulfobacteriota bacterium]
MVQVFRDPHALQKSGDFTSVPLRVSISKRIQVCVSRSLFFVLLIAMVGCSAGTQRVTVGHEKPAVVLPEASDNRIQEPYVIDGIPYYCLPSDSGFVEEGVASWYGGKFHGRNTSNGEIYDMHKKTAAHKTLPFGTHVKVQNLSNGKAVVVRINDRGPFVKGRIIDLSYAAAKDIDMIKPGTAKVRIAALSRKIGEIKIGKGYRPLLERKDFRKGKFSVQVGAFEVEDNAIRLAERLRVLFDHVTVTTHIPCTGRIFYRVRVSLCKDLNEINQIVDRLEYLGFLQTFIVAL